MQKRPAPTELEPGDQAAGAPAEPAEAATTEHKLSSKAYDTAPKGLHVELVKLQE